MKGRGAEAHGPGHAGIDLFADHEPTHAERFDRGAGGFAAGQHHLADAGRDQSACDFGEGTLDQDAGSVAAMFALRLGDLGG